MSETLSFTEEAARLSAPSARNIDGVEMWVNAGASQVAVIDIERLHRELLSDGGGNDVRFDLDTRVDEVGNIKHGHLRTVHGRAKTYLSQRTDIPKHVLEFHDLALTLGASLPLRSVETDIDIGQITRRTLNTAAHIDTPVQATSDLKIGKICIISAFHDQTQFLEDGYQFTGNQKSLFEKHGSLRDEAGLAGHLFNLDAGCVALFGSRTTIHCEPLHDYDLVRAMAKRTVAKSTIEFDLT